MKEAGKAFAKSIITVVITAIIAIVFLTSAVYSFLASSYYRFGNDNSLPIQDVSDALREENGQFSISVTGEELLDKHGAWAMLLDSSGNIIWSHKLPSELDRSYDIIDVAVFSKWFLDDYPVTVWQMGDTLLVVGEPKDSTAKYNLSFESEVFDFILSFGVIIIIVALAIVALITWVTGYRQYQSIRKIEEGLSVIADEEPVHLLAKGPMKRLQSTVNTVSDTLEQQRRIIADRDTARTNWVSGISHDVRTPLTLILGYSDELSRSENLPEEDKKKIQSINQQSLRIRKLVDDLNLVSKLEYEMQPLKISEVHMDALVREVAGDTLNSGLSPLYRLEVSVPQPAKKLAIQGDHNLLKRALQNAVDNSIRHNPNGCTIYLNLTSFGDECVVEVKDNGIGVDETKLAQLRDLSRHSISDSSAEKEQHGLGLRIASRIVLAHNGSVQINSVQDDGFSVQIALKTQ